MPISQWQAAGCFGLVIKKKLAQYFPTLGEWSKDFSVCLHATLVTVATIHTVKYIQYNILVYSWRFKVGSKQATCIYTLRLKLHFSLQNVREDKTMIMCSEYFAVMACCSLVTWNKTKNLSWDAFKVTNPAKFYCCHWLNTRQLANNIGTSQVISVWNNRLPCTIWEN
jgi:hypothetical protein